MNKQEIPAAVMAALDHVRSLHPEVVMVVYNSAQRWQFMDDDFGCPRFDQRIDVGLLEAAADAAYEVGLPCVFEHPEFTKNPH